MIFISSADSFFLISGYHLFLCGFFLNLRLFKERSFYLAYAQAWGAVGHGRESCQACGGNRNIFNPQLFRMIMLILIMMMICFALV